MSTASVDATEPLSTAGEPPACVWCSSAFDSASGRRAGRIVCGVCGAATTSPWPTDAELTAAYGGWYRPRNERRFRFFGDAILNRTRAALAGRIDAIAPAGAILDVGSGDGTLVDALRRRGRETTGLERGGERADLLDVPIEELEGEYAAIVFWHSLEHLRTPGTAVEAAARLLIPGGVVAIAVPDSASLQAAAFGDRWIHLDIPRHLVHLTSSALTTGIERSGLKITRRSLVRGGQIVIGWLDGLVGSLPGGLSLYRSLRRDPAQQAPIPTEKRIAAIVAGVAMLPVATGLALAEIAAGRSGTVYVEARRV